jgi:hypothetical protein
MRPAGETIDTSKYGVELLEESRAKAFVVEHHYSGSYPAARLRVGLFRSRELVGVAVFSVPMHNGVVPSYVEGLAPAAGIELGRFVLLDDVPANGETWFLGKAFRVLRAELPEVRALLSFSDPIRRVSADGSTVLPGHVGTIYQAHNGRYVGRSTARTVHVAADGRLVSPRALSKIRKDERGAAYALRQLLAMGAPERQPHEKGAAYVSRALIEGPFRRVRHPGNHAYLWPVGDTRIVRSFAPALAYPKRSEAA